MCGYVKCVLLFAGTRGLRLKINCTSSLHEWTRFIAVYSDVASVNKYSLFRLNTLYMYKHNICCTFITFYFVLIIVHKAEGNNIYNVCQNLNNTGRNIVCQNFETSNFFYSNIEAQPCHLSYLRLYVLSYLCFTVF